MLLRSRPRNRCHRCCRHRSSPVGRSSSTSNCYWNIQANWSAALAFPPAWFLYRKLYLPFTIFFLVPGLAFRVLTGTEQPMTMAAMQQPENEWLLMMNAAIFVSTMLASGGTANWFLYRRARAANWFVVQRQLSPAESLLLLRRVGGVNKVAVTLFVLLSLLLAVSTLGG